MREKGLKLAIFKPSENRIFPNNFFRVRKVALNIRIRVVKITLVILWAAITFCLPLGLSHKTCLFCLVEAGIWDINYDLRNKIGL